MSISDIPAIDVHAHYGIYRRKNAPLLERFMTGSAEKVVERATAAGIRATVASPLLALLPRFEADAVAGNEEANSVVDATPGLLQWVVINPLQPNTFHQATDRLPHPKCMGIKIHPEEHGYPIVEHGRKVFEFAARHRAVVLTHSGEQNSLPADCARLADDYPEMNLILAHLGFGWDGDQSHHVRAIQASKKGNVYVDTSSMSSIFSGLIEWAVSEIGSTHILFGTDTPLYSAAAHRRRIDTAEISEADKCAILRDNAVKLLKLPTD